MSLINTKVLPFNATVYHNGKDVKVSEANLKGKWSIVFFYPADFTIVCPTELEDLADNYAAFKKLGVEITIITDAQTTAIDSDGRRVNGMRYKDRNTGTEHTLELAGVFVQIGLVPNRDPIKGLVELSKFGEALTNHKVETSVPGIFVAGDISDAVFKQIIIATGRGGTSALGAFEYLIRSIDVVVTAKAA